MADNIFGPWQELENPCRGADADRIFYCQSTFVLPVQGRTDAFIAMFDRWKQWDLSASRYVWLPLRFEHGAPVVEWMSEWDLGHLPPLGTASLSR